MAAPSQEEMLQALETYFDLMTMNGGTYLFQTARQMGILDAFGDGPKTAAEVATELGYQEEATQRVLDVLAALGVLQHDGDQFQGALVLRSLTGDYTDLSAGYWEHLPVLLQTGVPYKAMDDESQSEAEYQKQAKALEWMARPAAAGLASQVVRMRSGLKILDVGAGSAVWSLAMLDADPEATATALDWPAVLEVAKASAADRGHDQRFKTIPGDFHKVDLPEAAFDLIIVANVTHIETPEGNVDLLRRLKGALRSGGEILVIDVFDEGVPEARLPKALYALGLALRTRHGQVYAPAELQRFCQEVGLEADDPLMLPVTPHTMGVMRVRHDVG